MNIEEFAEFIKTEEGIAAITELEKPLKEKNQQLLDEAKAAKGAITEIKTLEEKRLADEAAIKSAEDEKRLKEENDFEAYKKFHDDEIKKYADSVSHLKSQVARKEAERLITETASQFSKSPKPLQLLLKDRVTSNVTETGNVEIVVNDDKGEPMYHDGQPATINHLVESLKADEDYASFFSASGSSGSGTSESSPTPNSYKDMSSADFNLTKTMGNKI